jgi:hypothetical protein
MDFPLDIDLYIKKEIEWHTNNNCLYYYTYVTIILSQIDFLKV